MRTGWIALAPFVIVLVSCRKPSPDLAVTTDAASSRQASGMRPDAAPAPLTTPSPVTQPKSDAGAGAPQTELGGERDFTAGIVEYKPSTLKGAPVLVAVRSAQHAGFDRVTFEFSGDELPGYHLEYIDKPVRRCGSGDVTPIVGDGWLEVRFEPAHAHTEIGKPTIAKREQVLNLKLVRELELTCDFEAQVIWVLGVQSPHKFRAVPLKQPPRLAVDIRH